MSCDLMCVTGSKDHMTLRAGASHCKSASCIVWCPWDTAGGDKMYLICHVTSYDHPIEEKCKLMGGSFLCMYVIFIVCIYKPLKNKQIALTIYQSIYIKHCDSGDMFLICHVTSQEHMFNRLYEFTGGNPSLGVTTLPCLVGTGLMQVEI